MSIRNRSSSMDRQASTWTGPESGGPQNSLLLYLYTGVWSGSPTAPAAATLPAIVCPWIEVDGYNGTIMVEVAENNVGGATLHLEGSYDGSNWYALGYYTIVSAGTSQATLTRSVSTITVVQNDRYLYQILDAYPLIRARASASTGSLTVGVYAVPT